MWNVIKRHILKKTPLSKSVHSFLHIGNHPVNTLNKDYVIKDLREERSVLKQYQKLAHDIRDMFLEELYEFFSQQEHREIATIVKLIKLTYNIQNLFRRIRNNLGFKYRNPLTSVIVQQKNFLHTIKILKNWNQRYLQKLDD